MFDDKQFDVEHALGMYATSFVTIPAEAIYNQKTVKQFESTLATCHIYVIGLMPRVDFVGAKEESGGLITSYEVAGTARELRWPLPPELTLKYEKEVWYLENAKGGGPSRARKRRSSVLTMSRTPSVSRCFISGRHMERTDRAMRSTAC